jgi:hypothetical protein
MKKLLKTLGFATLAVGLLAVFPEAANASATYGQSVAGTGVDNLATNLKGTAKSVTDILSIISYVVGVGFGIKGALKFKEHNETKGQTPISQPLVLLAVAAFLLSLPTLLIMARDAVLGSGSTGVSIDNGGLRSLD